LPSVMMEVGGLPVHVGKRGIGLPVAEHWAVKVGETWFELEGAAIRDYNSPNKVRTHQRDADYAEIEEKTAKTLTNLATVQEWAEAWTQTHPLYRINGANCQKFVNDFLRTFLPGEEIEPTQNQTIGNSLLSVGTTVTALGAIAIGLGVAIGATGRLIRGTHADEDSKEKRAQNM